MTRTPPLAAGVLAITLALAPLAAADPAVDYALHCRGCHLQDGSGKPDAIPDLRGSMGRFLSVPGGRAYLVQVPGVATSSLAADRLADLLNWMLLAFSPDQLPADFRPYTTDEVADWRRAPLVEVEAVRRRLLAAMPEPSS